MPLTISSTTMANASLDQTHYLDKRQVRAAFDQAAARYEAAAVLQREVGDRLLERLEDIRLAPRHVLDVGAGTGRCARALAQRYHQARIIAVDLAPNMLRQARRQQSWWSRLKGKHLYICGDAERLPLAPACADLVFSNLTLQWCNDLDAVLQELRRVLRPGGLLLFSTLGPDTLQELRHSFAQVDTGTHVNNFLDMHDVGDALLRAQFADPVVDVDRLTLTYATIYELMRDLKTIGAHNVTAGRRRGLTGKQRLQSVAAAYEAFRTHGVLPASYEVVYGHAWAPLQTRQAGGVTKIAVQQLTRRNSHG